jgi:hypothetical protein
MYTFKENFLRKYNLKRYHSRNEPCIFFGCYKHYERDCEVIVRHRGFTIILWGGSDAQHIHKRTRHMRALRGKKNLWNIAMSDYIANDMERLGFKYKKIPVCPTRPEKFNPCPNGPYVYAYGSHTRIEDYGVDILRKIQNMAPDLKFIVGYSQPPGHVKYEQMPAVYKKCFCGLRLTRHDGLSNTVVELGLMGRRCFWNGGAPNEIPWGERQLSVIVERLRLERKLVGKTNKGVADAVRSWLDIGDGWLDTDFYV